MTVSRSTTIVLVVLGLIAAALGGVFFFDASMPSSTATASEDRPPAPTRLVSGSESALRDRPAPDFTRPQMNGDTFRLSNHRGRVVVINFWATWCPPCRMEIPGFVKLQKEYRGEGLTVVGVSMDDGGFSTVRPFADDMEINYPLVMDDGSVARQYGPVRALPSTFVVDPEGMIRHTRSGYLPEDQLRDWIEPLLAKTKG